MIHLRRLSSLHGYMKGYAYRSFMPKIGLDPDSLIDLGPVTAMSWAELTGGMFDSGVNEGYEAGYSIGYSDGEANGELMTDGFKDMAFAIFEAPSVLVGSMLDFDFFGINLYSLLKTLLTMSVVAAIVIVLIKFVM